MELIVTGYWESPGLNKMREDNNNTLVGKISIAAYSCGNKKVY